jgi:hypothetical protein
MRRLKDETRSPFTRALLASVEADRPASGARDRALGALGLGVAGAAGVVTASTTAKAAALGGSGANGAGASSVPPATAKGAALIWAKWIGIGVLGSSIAIGSAQYLRQVPATPAPGVGASEIAPSEPRTASPSPIPPSLAPIDPPAPTVPANASSSASGSTPALPSPVIRANGRGRPGALVSTRASSNAAREAGTVGTATVPAPAVSTSSRTADSVTAQLEALNGIRALELHAPESALVLLGGFEDRYPSSPLQEEIAVLRIDALADAGRGAEATTLADAFLVAHPASAYAQRVRSKVKPR